MTGPISDAQGLREREVRQAVKLEAVRLWPFNTHGARFTSIIAVMITRHAHVVDHAWLTICRWCFGFHYKPPGLSADEK